VHPDKAFTAGRAAPVTPDLAGANTARYGLRGHLTETDFTERARLGAVGYLASGATVIRAHTDVSPVFGTIPVTGAAGRKTWPRCATRSTRAPTWPAARLADRQLAVDRHGVAE